MRRIVAIVIGRTKEAKAKGPPAGVKYLLVNQVTPVNLEVRPKFWKILIILRSVAEEMSDAIVVLMTCSFFWVDVTVKNIMAKEAITAV